MFPPTVACERISRSATFAAQGPSGAAIPTSSCTGVIAPIVTREPSFAIPARPACPSISAFAGSQPPVRHVRDDDRPSTDDDDVRAVAESRDRLVLGARHEDLGRGVQSHTRCCHCPPFSFGVT